MVKPSEGRFVALAAIAALVPLVVACSSPDRGDGPDAPAAAADAAAVYVEKPPEYVLQQEFPLSIELTSSVFNRIRRIPIEYTCAANYYYPESSSDFRYGEDKSPPLAWTGVPQGTKSLAIVVDDPDAMTLEKGITAPRVHWAIWNIPPEVTELAEHLATTTELASVGPRTRQGANDLKTFGWAGPCPPPNITSIQRGGSSAPTQRPHGYRFRIFALDTELDVPAGVTKNELLEAMDGHVLAGGELKGEYVNKRLYK